MKLNQIKKLLEAPQLVVVNGELKKGFGLLYVHMGEPIDAQDLDCLEIFVEQDAFVKRIGELYDYTFHSDEPLDMSELHDDPEVKKALAKKIGKRAPKKKILKGEDCTTMQDLYLLPSWDQFIEGAFILDNF